MKTSEKPLKTIYTLSNEMFHWMTDCLDSPMSEAEFLEQRKIDYLYDLLHDESGTFRFPMALRSFNELHGTCYVKEDIRNRVVEMRGVDLGRLFYAPEGILNHLRWGQYGTGGLEDAISEACEDALYLLEADLQYGTLIVHKSPEQARHASIPGDPTPGRFYVDGEIPGYYLAYALPRDVSTGIPCTVEGWLTAPAYRGKR